MTKLIPVLALLVGLVAPAPTWAQGREGESGRPDSPPGQATRGPRGGQGHDASGPQSGLSGVAEGARASDRPICPSGVIPHPAACWCTGGERPEPLMRTVGDVDYRCPET